MESAGSWVARGGEMGFTTLAPDIFFRKLKKYYCNRKSPPYQLQYRPVKYLLLDACPTPALSPLDSIFLPLSRGHWYSAQRNTITASLSLAALVLHRTMMVF